MNDVVDLTDLRIEVGEMKGSVAILTRVCNKLDEAIENLREVSGNLVKLIATHEERFRHHDDADNALLERLDQHASDDTTRFDRIEQKIDDKMKSLEKVLSDKLDSHNKEINNLKKWGWIVLGGIGTLTLFSGVLTGNKLSTLSSIVDIIVGIFK